MTRQYVIWLTIFFSRRDSFSYSAYFFLSIDKTYYCMHDSSSCCEEHKNMIIKSMASVSRLPYQAEVQKA
jgi:hypothetical protein